MKSTLTFIGKGRVRDQAIVRDKNNVAFIKRSLKNKGEIDAIVPNTNSTKALSVLNDRTESVRGPSDILLKDLRTIKATETARNVVQSFKGPSPLTGNQPRTPS